MIQRCTCSSSRYPIVGLAVSALLLAGAPRVFAEAAAVERDPVKMSVVAANPSETKPQAVPVKIYLPKEVRPSDIIDPAGLTIEFDDDQSIYYLFKDGVELAPKETKVFEVMVRDVWHIPEDQITGLRTTAEQMLVRLEQTAYYEAGQAIVNNINTQLDMVLTEQNDEALSRKARIGAYRTHLQALEDVKEQLAELEKLLSFAGGVPVPEMLEESQVKSDAPSTKTTWLVIFLLVAFMGLLGGTFFFTWHRKTRLTDMTNVKQFAFPEAGQGGSPRPPAGGAPGGGAPPKPPA